MNFHEILKDVEEFLLRNVDELFNNSEITVEEHHTLAHSKIVLYHLNESLRYEYLDNICNANDTTNLKKILSLKCAAILHDVDDRKFFSNNKNYENARSILSKLKEYIFANTLILHTLLDIDLIVKIISLVSFSENGTDMDDIPPCEEWMLLVRQCDRLEAIGKPGILRAYTYSLFTNRPLYIDSTPTPKTLEELRREMTKERYLLYLSKKQSNSMIDHFFDKILFVCEDLQTSTNPYILSTSISRSNDTFSFILKFGNTKTINMDALENSSNILNYHI